MKHFKLVIQLTLFVAIFSCNDKSYEKNKGFSVAESILENDTLNEVYNDSLKMKTKAVGVQMTAFNRYRLTSIFKVNFNAKDEFYFTGSNDFRGSYSESNSNGNDWNNHIFPGFECLYGYNLVNMSLFDFETKTQKKFFKKPVLIKSFYFPSFETDTLNYKPVLRNCYLVTVYDEDTNKDGKVNFKDLRKIYYFDISGNNETKLLPDSYSVVGSDYDSANDYMYINAKLDENKNGQIEETEATQIFWFDLKNPLNSGTIY